MPNSFIGLTHNLVINIGIQIVKSYGNITDNFIRNSKSRLKSYHMYSGSADALAVLQQS